jgi:hypothetical protein
MSKTFGILALIILLAGCGYFPSTDDSMGTTQGLAEEIDHSDTNNSKTIISNNGLGIDSVNLITEIKNLIKDMNYCEQDSDCGFLREKISLGCPFGCFNLVNKNADASQIISLGTKYFEQNNPTCLYSCTLEPEEIRCLNNKCIGIH